jgi:K+-transporting ATPase ATPase C chain
VKNIRANLWLLVTTAVICCVLYPAVLYGIARTFFPTRAAGSLLNGTGEEATDGTRGSRLIAQPFTNDEYFWPRPSAASYNAAATGGSNWGANNPKLRDRVAQQLGPIIKYKAGSRSAGTGPEPRTPQQDIEAWFALQPDRAATWAADSSVAAPNWAKTDLANDKYGLQGEYILQWAKDHPEVIALWKKDNASKTDDPKPEDLVAQFFSSFAKVHPGKWPGVVETKRADGTTVRRIEPVTSDPVIHAIFFDLWLSDPANKDKGQDLDPVPADMVMASGSGMDPHITIRNALSPYQLDRVAAKRAASPADVEKLKQEITNLVREKSFTPLSGLVGEPLMNVLEVNIELDRRFPIPTAKP